MASPMTPSHVVIAYDATRDRGEPELKLTVDSLRMRGDILHSGDTIILLGVLHRVVHPCKCLMNCLHELELFLIGFKCLNLL